jgi:hypothetical protein
MVIEAAEVPPVKPLQENPNSASTIPLILAYLKLKQSVTLVTVNTKLSSQTSSEIRRSIVNPRDFDHDF